MVWRSQGGIIFTMGVILAGKHFLFILKRLVKNHQLINHYKIKRGPETVKKFGKNMPNIFSSDMSTSEPRFVP